MHTRELDGRVLRFGHRGWLWHNAFLLYDHATDSIWHHQTGRAMAGELRGQALARLPSSLMTYEAWLEEHPDTRVLPKPLDPSIPVDSDSYALRNARIQVGLGVEVPGGERFYPLPRLAGHGPVEEEVAGVPLVVAAHLESRSGFAYDRRVGGKIVSFRLGEAPEGAPILRESGGDRAWRLRSGRPVQTSGARGALRPVLFTLWEAVAWKNQHPRGTVWEP